MMRAWVRRFRRDTRGAAALEFAMTAICLLVLVIGIIESGLMFWSWQALQGAASDAARCAALDSTSCKDVATTPANTQSYAVTAASARGLSGVASGNVTVLTGTSAQSACGATSATVVSVSVSYVYGPVFLWSLKPSMTAAACFPMSATG